ncbi:hypothetical protein SAMN06265365_105237 [Tistlia consotensis]|uniref:Uncharacterized protein n=1 Tax=Tistlia consotensis USBA 355 TaxID=560819 RepID=A0A1Y6BK54_9PROT|nr:hypothetical protein [Tistlia consotensis]SMF12094.1 hypothetical protein SAMN05428998_10561 [Tistlia consotensis USBA 355]SNR51370.1 hypothetical protein SAMN06265365_105237 [Tistlia consotensis]
MDEIKSVDREDEPRFLMDVEDLDARGAVTAQFCYICHCSTWIDENEAE